LYRTTLIRTSGLRRLGILWALCLALLVLLAVLDPSHDITWLLVAILAPALLAILLWRRGKAQEAIMSPGSVWATGFGANELLIITPISTLVIDYAALKPPRIAGSSLLIPTRYGPSTTSLPLELFPPEAVTFLQQRTAQNH
jgi:Na+/proline symporter